MTEKNKYEAKNKDKLNIASKKLKKLVEKYPSDFKTKNLGNSLMKYSNQLEKDCKTKRRRNKTFKFGTLVYIDFGINFGSEFSAPHYGITLEKFDNKKKNTITVVPLTSKKGFNNLKLEESISKQIGALLAELGHEYVDKLHGELIKEMNDLLLNYLFYNPRMYDLPADPKEQKFLLETYDCAKNRFNEIIETLSKDREKIDYTKHRLEKYMADLDKNTYVKLDAITTIDKNKIFKPKNDLDPLGVIRLSDSVLELMSNELTKKFSFDRYKY